MDEKKNIVKILGYDKFKCIADKCKYTFCTGWDIEVDDKTYNKWSCDKANNILENIKTIENHDKKLYSVKKNTEEMVDFFENWINKYPILSIEDAMAKEDWDGWKVITERLGHKIQLVGYDLFVTNTERLKKGIEKGGANSILIKLNWYVN